MRQLLRAAAEEQWAPEDGLNRVGGFLPLHRLRECSGLTEIHGWSLERVLEGLADVDASSATTGCKCLLRQKGAGEWWVRFQDHAAQTPREAGPLAVGRHPVDALVLPMALHFLIPPQV